MTLEEKAIEAFKGRIWAMGIVLAEKTDMENAEIQFYMGFCREHGYGIEKDYGEAVDWYKKAAEQGHAKAMRNLGKMYDDGVLAHRDVVEAVKWYVDAAVKGDKIAKGALGKLAADEDTAPFVSLYAKTAFDNEEWKRGIVAALSTDMSNCTLQMWLAYCYSKGNGVEKNEDEAFKWCRKAAEGGNFWSMNKLGLMYEFGEGTEKDLEEAFKWYKASAEKGDSAGQYHLGDMYEHGKGTAKNAKLAVEWYAKAAKQGSKDAQKALERIEAAAAAAKDDPIKALDGMIGLQSVKDQVKKLVDTVRMQKMREEHGLPKIDMSYHCVFTGNPGTGKTTVARLYAKILYKLGIVKKDNFVEADRSKLLDTSYGGTEKETAKLVKLALDGVLFIDEAHTLYKENDERDSGREAIDTLLKQMEDNRDRLVVIVAGYTKKMEAFLGANEGMRSRFPNKIHFPDYSADELVEIFKFYARRKKYIPDDDALDAVRAEAEFELAKRAEGFGNARFIREDILARAVQSMSQRIAGLEKPSKEDLQRIVADDIPDNSGRNGHAESVDDVLKELDEMVGLRPVKEYIHNLANFVQIQKRRQEEGLPTGGGASYHCVFTGSPGTGKTTVARYMARIYRALGIIRTNHLEEADRPKLVGKYIGHTEEKTNKVIDAALNGVLFIDEAYSLANESENDFGREAIATLLKRMEDDRDRLVVIVAGYADEMRKFIGMNPGLQSRFSRYINFPDYSEGELVEIFTRLAKKGKFCLGEGALDAVRKIMGKLVAKKTKSFGNARDVEKFFNGVVGRQSSRLAKERNQTKEQLSTILLEDVCDIPAAGGERMADAQVVAAHGGDAAQRKMEDGGVVVEVDYSPCLNLAMALNNAQFVFRVQIHNGTGSPLSGCELSLTSPDDMFDEWSAGIGDLASGDVADICKMSIRLNAGLLEKVASARPGSMRLTLRADGKTAFSQNCEVNIVPANYLPAVMLNPALLAAYVLPTSAIVRQVQSDAMRILDAETGIAAFAGYADGEGTVGYVCEAVFRAIRNLGIRFATAPASLGLPGQKIRVPAEIMQYKLGNCLDLTLLFAAVLEECRLNTVVVLVSGHAFLGVSRSGRHFSHTVMTDLGLLKKACDDGQMLFIEATRVCGVANTFQSALQSAASNLMGLTEEEFRCAIDVGMARHDNILPLPIDNLDRGGPAAVATTGSLASAVPCGGEGGALTEARIAPMAKPCMVKFYDEKISVRTWKDVFEVLVRKMNERDPAKFDALPGDSQFGRYFMRIEPGRRTPHDYFKIKLGTSFDVRAKAITGRAYLWRTDYYFRRLMDHLGIDVGRVEIA